MSIFSRPVTQYALGFIAAGVAFHAGSGRAEAFDFDTGNAPVEVIIPTAIPTIYGSVSSPGDASLILRYTTLLTNAWFDSIAPYEPTTIGVYSHLTRCPA